MTVIIEAGTGLERSCFPKIMAIIELEVQAKGRSKLGTRG